MFIIGILFVYIHLIFLLSYYWYLTVLSQLFYFEYFIHRFSYYWLKLICQNLYHGYSQLVHGLKTFNTLFKNFMLQFLKIKLKIICKFYEFLLNKVLSKIFKT